MFNIVDQINNLEEIIHQTNSLSFESRLCLNQPTGDFFSDPWIVKEKFKNTPLGNILNGVDRVGEARLIKLQSAETYTAHADPDDRYHLPIITNPYAFIIDVENLKMYHLPADGKIWMMDTSLIHVASNYGGRERIHLNIRILLPKFKDDHTGITLKIKGGNFDWKQESYIEIMPFINRQIKEKNILGFDRINDREIRLNIVNKLLLKSIVESLSKKGFDIVIG